MSKKKYQLDRTKFIHWYSNKVWLMTFQPIILEDLIKGGEFILTAEDVLNSIEYIKGSLVGQSVDVRSSDCELVYKGEAEKLTE